MATQTQRQDAALDPEGSSLRYTTRNDFSFLSKSLQRLIKPLRPRLVAPPRTPFPAGSPAISPIPAPLGRRCQVDEQVVKDVYTYALSPKSAGRGHGVSPAKHHIYYFCGGGFQNTPSSDHWKFLAELSSRLSGLDNGNQIHVVSYPLAPSSPAADSLRILRLWLEHVLARAAQDATTVALAGDSSGGNIALTLAVGITGGWTGSFEDGENASPAPGLPDASATQAINAEDPLTAGRSPHASALVRVLLLCPAADMRNRNPEMDMVTRLDPILTSDFTGIVAKIWCGTVSSTAHPSAVRALSVRKAPEREAQLENTDPRVSPVLADLRGLARCRVRVDGLIAGHDVLSPDAKILVEKLREAGVPGEWQFWENMMHCWPLTWWARVPESLETLDWMVHRMDIHEHRRVIPNAKHEAALRENQ